MLSKYFILLFALLFLSFKILSQEPEKVTKEEYIDVYNLGFTFVNSVNNNKLDSISTIMDYELTKLMKPEVITKLHFSNKDKYGKAIKLVNYKMYKKSDNLFLIDYHFSAEKEDFVFQVIINPDMKVQGFYVFSVNFQE